jgi:hypothetical protein
VGTNVVNLQERQANKQYQQFYGRKCSNFGESYGLDEFEAFKKPVKTTKDSYTKDYIKLLTNFHSKGGDQ